MHACILVGEHRTAAALKRLYCVSDQPFSLHRVMPAFLKLARASAVSEEGMSTLSTYILSAADGVVAARMAIGGRPLRLGRQGWAGPG